MKRKMSVSVGLTDRIHILLPGRNVNLFLIPPPFPVCSRYFDDLACPGIELSSRAVTTDQGSARAVVVATLLITASLA